MDPSYNPFNGSQSGNAGASGAVGSAGASGIVGAGTGASGIVGTGAGASGAGVISSGTGDVVLASDGKKSKKPWIIAGVVAVVVAVVCAVAALVLMNGGFKGNREDADELFSILGQVAFSGQCPLVVNNVGKTSISVDEYVKYIGECKIKTMDVTELKNKISSLSNSEEYRQLYSEFNDEINNVFVVGEQLESDLNVYRVWHEWILNVADMLNYQIDASIKKAADPLLKSNNNEVVALGNRWIEKQKALNMAKTMFNMVGDEESQEELDRVQADYDNFMDEMTRSLRGLVKLDDNEDLGSMWLSMYKIKEYISDEN